METIGKAKRRRKCDLSPAEMEALNAKTAAQEAAWKEYLESPERVDETLKHALYLQNKQ